MLCRPSFHSGNDKVFNCRCHYILELYGNKGRKKCVGVGGPKALARKFAGAWPDTKRWRHMISSVKVDGRSTSSYQRACRDLHDVCDVRHEADRCNTTASSSTLKDLVLIAILIRLLTSR